MTREIWCGHTSLKSTPSIEKLDGKIRARMSKVSRITDNNEFVI